MFWPLLSTGVHWNMYFWWASSKVWRSGRRRSSNLKVSKSFQQAHCLSPGNSGAGACVDLYVCPEINSSWAGEAKLWATEGFSPNMCQHVIPKPGLIVTGIVALPTIEKLFSWMSWRVFPESGALIGGVLALCANKWLLTTVNPRVIYEAAQFIDCEVALVATVGLHFIIQRLLGAFCRFVCLHFHDLRFQGSFKLHLEAMFKENWKQQDRMKE